MKILNGLILTALAPLAAGSAPTPPAKPGPPTVTALAMGWKVAFTPLKGALNYIVTDPDQHWFSSAAGSAHLQPQSPVFVQGLSGGGGASASLQVFAQTESGWVPITTVSKPVGTAGKPPAFTDPYWIYHDGQFNWSCDFSWVGGDAGALLPQFGGTGTRPNPEDVSISWFDLSVPAVSGPETIRITHPVTGNFAPCILGTTVDFVAHSYAFWTIAIRPDYENANYTVVFEGTNDAVVSNTVTLAPYVAKPFKGAFRTGAWNIVNVPLSAFGPRAGVYKMVIQQVSGTQGTWHVDDLGLTNTAR